MTDAPADTNPANAYFHRIDATRFRPTPHAGGAWNPGEIHFSPLGGLMVHAMELHRAAIGDDGKQLGRVSFDILGFLADDVCGVNVETVRAGRTIELVQATVTIAGRAVAVGRAWFMVGGDTSAVEGGEPKQMPDPQDLASWDLKKTWDLTQTWNGGYVASLEERAVTPPQPGRTSAWLRTDVALVAGEPVGPTAAFIALVDTANGIAVRESPKEWMFPNLDLTIHLYRQPTGRWVGLDTTVTFGPTGRGLTSTELHDIHGPVGRAAQILTVRPMS